MERRGIVIFLLVNIPSSDEKMKNSVHTKSYIEVFRGSLVRKLRVFSGNVVPGVEEVGSLFPRDQGSIWASYR